MRSATKPLAQMVLGQVEGPISMLVQYNPDSEYSITRGFLSDLFFRFLRTDSVFLMFLKKILFAQLLIHVESWFKCFQHSSI